MATRHGPEGPVVIQRQVELEIVVCERERAAERESEAYRGETERERENEQRLDDWPDGHPAPDCARDDCYAKFDD